jgi:hypothetical protein
LHLAARFARLLAEEENRFEGKDLVKASLGSIYNEAAALLLFPELTSASAASAASFSGVPLRKRLVEVEEERRRQLVLEQRADLDHLRRQAIEEEARVKEQLAAAQAHAEKGKDSPRLRRKDSKRVTVVLDLGVVADRTETISFSKATDAEDDDVYQAADVEGQLTMDFGENGKRNAPGETDEFIHIQLDWDQTQEEDQQHRAAKKIQSFHRRRVGLLQSLSRQREALARNLIGSLIFGGGHAEEGREGGEMGSD